MIGLDTNVLYRLLFVDDERQSGMARDFVRAGVERGDASTSESSSGQGEPKNLKADPPRLARQPTA